MPSVELAGNPVQAVESHDVVDAQRVGPAERVTQHGDDVAVLARPDADRVQRRESPVLARLEEGIGRGAPAHGRGEGLGLPPRVEARRVHPDGHVEIQAGRALGHAGGRELGGRHPLGVEVVPLGGGVDQLRWHLPRTRTAPGRLAGTGHLVGCTEARVGRDLGVGAHPVFERLAAGAPVLEEGLGQGGEDAPRRGHDRRVVDEHRLAGCRHGPADVVGLEQGDGRRGDLELGQGGRVHVELVPGQLRDREVGTRVDGFVQVGRVEGQRADKLAAEALHPAGERCKVAVATDAGVRVGAQGMQRQERPPAPRRLGAARRDHQQALGLHARRLEAQAVVARRQVGRRCAEPELVGAESAPVARQGPDRAGDRRAEPLALDRPVLELEDLPAVARMDVGGQLDHQVLRVTDVVDEHRLEGAPLGRRLAPQRLGGATGRVDRRAQRPEHRHQCLGRRLVLRAVDAFIRRDHPPRLGQGGELGARAWRLSSFRRCAHRSPRMSRTPSAGMSTHSGRALAS